MNKPFFFIITVFFIFSCSSDKSAPTAAKVPLGTDGGDRGVLQKPGPAAGPYVVEITPKEGTRKSTFSMITTGFDTANARIEWLVNDRPLTTLVSTQFSGADAAKGDAVQARVVLKDREILSNIVLIVNAPPDITRVKLLPEVFKPRDVLNVDVEGIDIDGDKVTFLYEWTKNGWLAGRGNAIDAPLKRGDKVSVMITPFDGELYGVPVVLSREISNFPPMIVDHKEFTFDGTVYTYQVRASDPDGDALTYSLETPPNGMTIDPSTGLLKWVVPSEFKGNKDVTVTVNDGHGGTAKYGITITIR